MNPTMKAIYKMFCNKGNFFYHKTVSEKAALLYNIAEMAITGYGHSSGEEKRKNVREQAEFLDKWKTG